MLVWGFMYALSSDPHKLNVFFILCQKTWLIKVKKFAQGHTDVTRI